MNIDVLLANGSHILIYKKNEDNFKDPLFWNCSDINTINDILELISAMLKILKQIILDYLIFMIIVNLKKLIKKGSCYILVMKI